MAYDLSKIKPTLREAASLKGDWRKHPRYRGCVGHWLFNTIGGLTEYDLSGNRNNGVQATSLGNAGSFIGLTRFLNGSTDYITLSTAIPLTTRSTISTWLYPEASGANTWRAVLGTGVNDEAIFLSDSNVLHMFNTTSVLEGSVTIPVDTWTHIAYTWDGATSSFYVNGTVDTTSAIAPFSDSLVIGTDNPLDFTEAYNGALEDFRIYNRVLAQHEITSLANNPLLEFGWAQRQRRRARTLGNVAAAAATTPYYFRRMGMG